MSLLDHFSAFEIDVAVLCSIASGEDLSGYKDILYGLGLTRSELGMLCLNAKDWYSKQREERASKRRRTHSDTATGVFSGPGFFQ